MNPTSGLELLPASEAIGGSLDVIIPEDLRAAHKHGGKLYVELTFGIVKGGPQGVMGALATAKDITQSYLASRERPASMSTDG